MSVVSPDKHHQPAKENRRIILIWRTNNGNCFYIFLYILIYSMEAIACGAAEKIVPLSDVARSLIELAQC
jgi:hypothetical protein